MFVNEKQFQTQQCVLPRHASFPKVEESESQLRFLWTVGDVAEHHEVESVGGDDMRGGKASIGDLVSSSVTGTGVVNGFPVGLLRHGFGWSRVFPDSDVGEVKKAKPVEVFIIIHRGRQIVRDVDRGLKARLIAGVIIE